MTGPSEWLPALVELKSYGGAWDRYLEALYQYFRDDFIESKPDFPERRWAVKRHPVADGKEATFWHITSDGKTEGERTPDLRRCERIRWPRPLIEAFGTGAVHTWKNKRGRSDRVLISTLDYSYVVVLEDRGTSSCSGRHTLSKGPISGRSWSVSTGTPALHQEHDPPKAEAAKACARTASLLAPTHGG
jgi:hypothetical protein